MVIPGDQEMCSGVAEWADSDTMLTAEAANAAQLCVANLQDCVPLPSGLCMCEPQNKYVLSVN